MGARVDVEAGCISSAWIAAATGQRAVFTPPTAGFTKFIPVAELQDASKGFIVGDEVHIKARALAWLLRGEQTCCCCFLGCWLCWCSLRSNALEL